MRRDTAELVAAYVDGVGELDIEERRRVERYLASDPAARDDEAATREILGKLRELPASPKEPDWTALERSIHAAVPDHAPRSFWHRWRFVIPVLALGGATALAIGLTRSPAPEAPIAVIDHPRVPAPVSDDDTVAIYLDGTDTELPLDSGDLADEIDDLAFAEDDVDDSSVDGFLGPDDLQWVDDLDDSAIEHVDGWLARPLVHRGGKT